MQNCATRGREVITAERLPIVLKKSYFIPGSVLKRLMFLACCMISAGNSVSGISAMCQTGIPI